MANIGSSNTESVLEWAVENNGYVVAHSTNGMTYTGRVLSFDEGNGCLVVEYENKGEIKKTDLYRDNLCCLMESTKEEIDRVRQEKSNKRKPKNNV
jgi:hypothetical protein